LTQIFEIVEESGRTKTTYDPYVAGRSHDADVVSNQAKFSPAEVDKAKTNLREFGAGATDTAAQLAGGAVANSLIGAFGREVATRVASPFKLANHSTVAADYGPGPALATTNASLLYLDTSANKPTAKKQ
jgi:hypothetical protein